MYERRDRVRVHAPPAKSASANVYITCTVAMAHSVTNAGIMRRNTPGFYSKLSAYLESPCAAQYEVSESLSDKPVCPFNSQLSIIGGSFSAKEKSYVDR